EHLETASAPIARLEVPQRRSELRLVRSLSGRPRTTTRVGSPDSAGDGGSSFAWTPSARSHRGLPTGASGPDRGSPRAVPGRRARTRRGGAPPLPSGRAAAAG